MRRIGILAVGKLKDPSLRSICEDYYRRCSGLLQVEERQLRDARSLHQALPSRAMVVALDERGTQLTSRQFAQHLTRWLQEQSAGVVFCIGGADGLHRQTIERAQLRLSFGKMTFAHRLVRLLLAEQLYRAVSIIEGAPYHRD